MNRSAHRVAKVGAILAVAAGLFAPAANAMILPPDPGFTHGAHAATCNVKPATHANRILPTDLGFSKAPGRLCR
jgi:hypothetical protein